MFPFTNSLGEPYPFWVSGGICLALLTAAISSLIESAFPEESAITGKSIAISVCIIYYFMFRGDAKNNSDDDDNPQWNERFSFSKSQPQDPPEPEISIADVILDLTDDKPLDATDVINVTNAKDEIVRIRDIAAEFLATATAVDATDDDELYEEDQHNDEAVRHAIYDKQDYSSSENLVCDKSDERRNLIYNSIKSNIFFEQNSEDELLALVDVFKPETYKAGDNVVNQGEEGHRLFLVESGKLNIHITVRGDNPYEHDTKELNVGEYSRGSSFGELALIFNSPRAATITATSDCKLWSLERYAYRSVISQVRYKLHNKKKEYLSSCQVSDGRTFSDVFNAQQIGDMSIAMKYDVYEEGQVILRQGKKGQNFYILESGVIEKYCDDKSEGNVELNKAFGMTYSLRLSGEASPVTLKATSQVALFSMAWTDFEDIIGPVKEFAAGRLLRKRSSEKHEAKRFFRQKSSSMEDFSYLTLDDLDIYNVLGRGAFGAVSLALSKGTEKPFALKALSKHYLEQKGLKDHVSAELRIIKAIVHPNILRLHCAMQDKKYLYMLMDLLPGGNLMSYLVKQTRQRKVGFDEDTTRFYAASIVLAYETFHRLLIAHRDMKPEHVVLTKKGYGVISDFAVCKEVVNGATFTFCGTPDYLAPEVILGTGHDWSVDYWSLGVFLFEMVNGTAPFYATNQSRGTRKILKGFDYVNIPTHFSAGLSDLISNLLVSNPLKRLGRTVNGVQNIKNHHWFAGFDWDSFNEQKLMAPIRPHVPADIKTLGKKKQKESDLDEEDSDWWLDLDNLKEF